ncbi:SOCE-associated regulatory factor of calcium homoeostasis [Spironucleus salmonicida]|uniref:Store-operated calcium entry-associated regulatory factor n=1 Tax=Spironucleus salmonicida TaxID=348837 RepID=V6LX39_9EUKA|nr:SOCE-associated regulatory factor of calcium homoeostasis [Spironucleus salmonicida]|eukprot:EST48276.1 hypothetical protein SS50377_11617 [Spironucleus salmonicida]
MLGLLIDLFLGEQNSSKYLDQVTEVTFQQDKINNNKYHFQTIYCQNHRESWKCFDQKDQQIFNFKIQCVKDDNNRYYLDSCQISPQYNIYETVAESRQDPIHHEQNDYNYSNFRNQQQHNFENQNSQPIILRDIQTLLFKKSERTKSRRGEVYNQLQQNGLYQMYLDEVVCANNGWDGQGIIWKCNSNLPKGFKFSNTQVSCEGWNGPGDKLIVPGSCSLNYSLARK